MSTNASPPSLRASPAMHKADGIWFGFQTVPGTLADPQAHTETLDTLVIEEGCLVWIGPAQALPPAYSAFPRHPVHGTWLTPGLVDCHTHLVYGGQRAREFAMRLEGASYEDIAVLGVVLCPPDKPPAWPVKKNCLPVLPPD